MTNSSKVKPVMTPVETCGRFLSMKRTMNRRSRWGLCLLLLSSWHGPVSPFTSKRRLLSRSGTGIDDSRNSPLVEMHYGVVEKQEERAQSTTAPHLQLEEGRKRDVGMTFVGKKSVSTAPMIMPRGGVKDLNNFFSEAENRNLLFFRNDVNALTNPSEDLIRRWSAEVALHGGSDIFQAVEKGNKNILRMKACLKMPGLRVMSETIVGANLILGDKGDSFPEYQFTVIDTKLTPEGTAPLVWLFKKVTKYMEKTSSFSRVRPVRVGGDDIVLVTDARLETKIRLPSAVARVLPINVTKFEQQGSRSMQRLLEKELEPALLCFQRALVECCSA
mmetsp:Transcript_32848/g.60523  ORF Transcript_32848/g.60523 Transcript_32848/m.60523 type:complete len:332 (-) Transcript_32848:23-1018(-)